LQDEQRQRADAKERTMRRLQQLLEIEERHRSYGSLAEAEAAATLIQELLTKHKLELSDVERKAEEEKDPMSTETLYPSRYGGNLEKGRVQWAEMIAEAVALAYYCMHLFALDSNILWLAGRKSDTDIAAGVFYRLCRTALTLCERDKEAAKKRAYRSGGKWTGAELFRRSYLYGFADAITRRLNQKRAEMDALAGQSQALVVTRDAVVKYVAKEIEPTEVDSLPTPEMDFEALKLGMIRGHEANIDGADLSAAPNADNKQLT
jgi:hypothetical protein